MSCDKLVYDLSQEVEGSPNVFIRKDWLNILDNQNQNYQSNQSIIDTSQLSNSNKYMAYREGYLVVPMLLNQVINTAAGFNFTTEDYTMGLKNWFGSVIHSFTLDYNGTTIIQQTPFCNMWNSFKLLTTLSWQDVYNQGPTIGFYPDSGSSTVFNQNATVSGQGTTNNRNTNIWLLNSAFTHGINGGGFVNTGFQQRITNINFNPAQPQGALVGSPTYAQRGITNGDARSLWMAHITGQDGLAVGQPSLKQISVIGIVYLKHIHSFFNMVPLLKGAFMKMTMNLNNSDCEINTTDERLQSLISSTVPVGGVQPIMIPSAREDFGLMGIPPAVCNITTSLSIGNKNLSQKITQAYTARVNKSPVDGPLSSSIYLYVPAYTFNPPFEQAYLSSPVKQIKYTDIYQYQVVGIQAGSQFNNLITNGIANIKSVLIIPFYSSTDNDATGTGLAPQTNPVYQSPWDPAGTGCTSPFVQFNNFNVQISGQNAIYNMERYTFEQFNNQLYGQNSVNGGLTDGLTSGLINFNDFKGAYAYYYVNVERMLPVEQSVPKSVQIIGTNLSTQKIDMWVFIEYGVEVSLDLLTGARV